MPSTRRFPAPWSVEEQAACFIVRDDSRQALAYVHFEEEPGRRSAAKLLSKDEARRIAVNFARLPDPTEVAAALGLRPPARGVTEVSDTYPEAVRTFLRQPGLLSVARDGGGTGGNQM